MLRAESNLELLRRRRKDPDARNQLVLDNLGLVEYIAREYPFGEHEDLVQEGIIGLMDAVRIFDFKKGGNFGALAARCIRNAIGRWLRQNRWFVKPPAHLHDLWTRINRSVERLREQLDRDPTTDEIVCDLNANGKRTTLKRVVEALALNVDCLPLPLDEFRDHGEGSRRRTMMDVTASSADTVQEAFRALGGKELREILMALNPKKRRILLMRFVGEMTYREIGALLGCTDSAASFAVRDTLPRLRRLIENSRYVAGVA